jgi:hypothetical protein
MNFCVDCPLTLILLAYRERAAECLSCLQHTEHQQMYLFQNYGSKICASSYIQMN